MMKILFLGYGDCNLLKFLSERAEVFQSTSRMTLFEIKELSPDMILSYGYLHIIKKDVIEAYEGKIINLHISYLPWNKGIYPNIWSIIDGTPKGVSIHLIDEGVDTGDIIFQREVEINDDDTLSSSYWRLRENIEDLFMEKWDLIKNFNFYRKKQILDGTFHLRKMSERYFQSLGILDNWEISVKELKKKSGHKINELE